MPGSMQSLRTLRDGTRRRKPRDTNDTTRALTQLDSTPIRDHWIRLKDYHKQCQPHVDTNLWITDSLASEAALAGRHSPMGILDTIAREFIVQWMPEAEVCVRSVSSSKHFKNNRALCGALVRGLKQNVYGACNYVNCGSDKSALLLKSIVQERAQHYIDTISGLYTNKWGESEELDLSRSDHVLIMEEAGADTDLVDISTGSATIPEAQILDSTLAWSLKDVSPRLSSPVLVMRSKRTRKRNISVTDFDEPDPTDNGQVWGMSPTRSCEFTFPYITHVNKKVKYLVTNENGTKFDSDVGIVRPKAEEQTEPSARKMSMGTVVDLTDDDHDPEDIVRNRDSCVLM